MSAEAIHTLGSGMLHDAVLALLDGTCPVQRLAGPEAMPPRELVVALHDDGRLPRDLAIQRAARAAGAYLLHVRLDGPLGLIGPTVLPDTPGCLACAETRRRAVARLPATDPRPSRPGRPGAEHAPPFVAAMAEIAADIVRTRRVLGWQVFVLQAADLSGQWHSFQPVPSCRHCGGIPDDGPEGAWSERRNIPQIAPGSFRERPLPRSHELRGHLLDWRYGVVPHVFRVQGNTPMAMCGAQFTMRDAPRDAGWGRASSYARAETVAFFEALERYASLEPRGRRLVVRGTLAALRDDALDPRRLGMPDPALAARQPGHRKAFSDDLEVSWVWGYSFAQARPILVPAQCVYYGRGLSESNRFVHESSNGAASGASLQEATLYGILEIMERDAFLMAWYGQLPLREIVADGAHNREIGFLIDKAEAHGYRVHLFDMTMDLGVTAVWGLAVSPDDDRPKSFSAAAAHPDPEQAVLGALREVVPDALLYQRKDEHTDQALREMLRDAGKVRSLDDHVALYTLPEAFERLSFLFSGDRARLAEVAPDWRERWARPTIDGSLAMLLAHLAGQGLDVIAVDLTAPEQRELGLRSVKVLIPGTLPMTFGALQRRTWGLPRLLEVPARLGRWSRPRTYDELDFHPHPFP